MWNLDETSFCTDLSKIKVVGGKNFQASEGEEVSVLMVASATGGKIPPLIIFKENNIWDQ